MDPIRVLVVEDDPLVACVLRNAVLDALPGAACDVAASLSLALELLGPLAHRLVILDLGLADSAGLATLDAIAAWVGLEHVLVVTGAIDLEPEVTARHAAFVGKPFKRSALIEAIRSTAASRPSASSLFSLLEARCLDLEACVFGHRGVA